MGTPSELKALLVRSKEAGLASQEKGRRFEEFARGFFGEVFMVVETNLRTEAGELDLVLENRIVSPFWMIFDSDAFVECKHLSRGMPLKEVGAFAHKLDGLGVKLGFVVSMSGFTEDAFRDIRNQAASGARALLVPLDGNDLQEAVNKTESIEEFLKMKIREIKYLKRF